MNVPQLKRNRENSVAPARLGRSAHAAVGLYSPPRPTPRRFTSRRSSAKASASRPIVSDAELSHYDYELPVELIAQQPLHERSDARLLVVNRAQASIAHHYVRDLPELLRAGDMVVVNESKVVPARLLGRRERTGGNWEGLFLSVGADGRWHLLSKTRGKVQPGEWIVLVDNTGRDACRLQFAAREGEGVWRAKPESADDAYAILDRVGRVPLPCYIREGVSEPGDLERYQTVYARVPGSAAAPTAGLHLTDRLIGRLETRGVSLARVTLHVGLDTFRPIGVERLAEHRMHREWGEIDHATAERLRAVRPSGGRIVAIGTTSTRVLETAARQGDLAAWRGETDLFIRPPHVFHGVDALLTNFHLPRSTLLVLVRTFGGDELIQRAYDAAIRERYRFYSYGDAMLIV
ncbi:MAG: tRNA preQ1(34) S-adenosylmethionine ribosyltransferase-isomerase QueA [Pirellulales bacterium]|nr:tRNA preQ1(34) S-adenosylmethionine ribosyltransferase-isomerase QueA [Pirellulales bacterium]